MRRNAVFTALLAAIDLFGNAPACGHAAAEQASPHTVNIAAHVTEASQRFGIPENWIYAVIRTESAGRIGAVSSAGAMGLLQLMPGTWARQRDRFALGADPFDPRDNIMAGTSYLREMYDNYGAPGFLAAYNAGPGRYEDWRDRGRPLPAETRAYVAKIATLLQSNGTPITLASTSPVRTRRRSWTDSALFAQQFRVAEAALLADIGEGAAAAPPSSLRPRSGLFAPVSGSQMR